MLFLLDELLSRTNSHDRRIGAAAIARGLVDRGAVGLIRIHDLALANIEQDLQNISTPGISAVNVHFDDEINQGRIFFDYRLRPGVVVHSNALELMRSVGFRFLKSRLGLVTQCPYVVRRACSDQTVRQVP